MGRLALIAMLLVAFAPSISRVLASGTGEVLAGGSQLCSSMGLKTLPSAGSASPADAPVSQMPVGGGDLCDYCPLAASLPMVLLALVFLLPVLHRHVPPLRVAPRLRVVHNLRGLGSRGPPILL
jgi:hypothetical protein